jgi:hypothetical protein
MSGHVLVQNRFHAYTQGSNLKHLFDRSLISIESKCLTGYGDPIDYNFDPMDKYNRAKLKVKFDDITPSGSWDNYPDGIEPISVMMDDEDAGEIHDFILDNIDTDFVIHCDGGFSRSVAIGSFMEHFYEFNVNYYESGSDRYKNIHVYNLLRRDHMNR